MVTIVFIGSITQTYCQVIKQRTVITLLISSLVANKHVKQIFTCAGSTVTLISTKATTDVGTFCVVTQSVEMALVLFRGYTFIDVCYKTKDGLWLISIGTGQCWGKIRKEAGKPKISRIFMKNFLTIVCEIIHKTFYQPVHVFPSPVYPTRQRQT